MCDHDICVRRALDTHYVRWKSARRALRSHYARGGGGSGGKLRDVGMAPGGRMPRSTGLTTRTTNRYGLDGRKPAAHAAMGWHVDGWDSERSELERRFGGWCCEGIGMSPAQGIDAEDVCVAACVAAYVAPRAAVAVA